MSEKPLKALRSNQDDAIVERLLDAPLSKTNSTTFGSAVRYDHGRGRWLYWDGIRWRVDGTRRVYDMLRLTLVYLIGEMPDDDDNMVRKSLISALNVSKKESVLKSLSARPEVSMKGDEWDTDPYLMGFENGIVDLRTGAFDPKPSPETLVSKSTGTIYDPKAKCPKFYSFLRSITGDDEDLVDYLLQLLGYSMFGLQAEQKFWMWVGRGANGKGILARTMLRVLGDYAERPSDELYMRNKFGAAPSNAARPDLVRLMGSRFIYISEPHGGQFNEELLKAHTGDDPILARDLYGKSSEMLTFKPTHKIIVLTNEMPKTDDVGVSMRRRVRVIRFEQDFSPESGRADFRLEGKIENEAEGILALLVRSAIIWWNEGDAGLPEPEKVTEWSREYIEDNDPLSRWEHDMCRFGGDEKGQSALLYGSYLDWCAQNGLEPKSQIWMSNQLSKRYRKERGRTGAIFYGLALKGAVEVAEDEDD